MLNRPYAFVQWLQKAKIKERFVLMSEPDHIWLKPMPNLMHGNQPAAFPFFYIEPSKKENLPITEKFTGKLTLPQAESIAPIGGYSLLWTASVLPAYDCTHVSAMQTNAFFECQSCSMPGGGQTELKPCYALTGICICNASACEVQGTSLTLLHVLQAMHPPLSAWKTSNAWHRCG